MSIFSGATAWMTFRKSSDEIQRFRSFIFPINSLKLTRLVTDSSFTGLYIQSSLPVK